jgi:hypothetical protein
MKRSNCRTGLKLALLLSLVAVGSVTLIHPAEAVPAGPIGTCLSYSLNSNGWYTLTSSGHGDTASACQSNSVFRRIFIPDK